MRIEIRKLVIALIVLIFAVVSASAGERKGGGVGGYKGYPSINTYEDGIVPLDEVLPTPANTSTENSVEDVVEFTSKLITGAYELDSEGSSCNFAGEAICNATCIRKAGTNRILFVGCEPTNNPTQFVCQCTWVQAPPGPYVPQDPYWPIFY